MKRLKQQKGQSLIEMIIALSVMILVVLALVSAITVSMRNANFSRNQSLATKYAQETLENIRAFRDQNDWTDFTKANCESPPGLVAPTAPFTRSITCTGSGDTKAVTVIVQWIDFQGDSQKTHKSELTTILTNWK